MRPEEKDDELQVEEMIREAFWNQYSPGCNEPYLIHLLRKSPVFIPELCWIALDRGKVIGNILYTKASLWDDDGKRLEVLSLGPLAVAPGFQNRGIGKQLIYRTQSLAKALGYSAIFLYGDPQYYGKQGFAPAETFHICTSDNQFADALQVKVLIEGALPRKGGRYEEAAVFDIDEKAAKAYDKRFPEKPLEDDTPSQRRFKQVVALRKPAR